MLKKNANGDVKLHIFDTCTETIKCLTSITHDKLNPSDCATQPHNITHLPDALRYFAVQHYRAQAPKKPVKAEFFSFEKWMDVFHRAGIDPAFYANRAFGLDEWLPWDIIDCGVSKSYLKREYERAYRHETTPSCAEHCNGCGANKLGGKTKWCK